MNIVDAFKEAQKQGKDCVELRIYKSRPLQFASLRGGHIFELLTAANMHTLGKIRVAPADDPAQFMGTSDFMSDEWYPSNMKRQTLLDIQQADGSCARYDVDPWEGTPGPA